MRMARVGKIVAIYKRFTEIAHSEDVYGTKWLKTNLYKKHGDSVYFVEIGSTYVVCFKRIVDCLITET